MPRAWETEELNDDWQSQSKGDESRSSPVLIENEKTIPSAPVSSLNPFPSRVSPSWLLQQQSLVHPTTDSSTVRVLPFAQSAFKESRRFKDIFSPLTIEHLFSREESASLLRQSVPLELGDMELQSRRVTRNKQSLSGKGKSVTNSSPLFREYDTATKYRLSALLDEVNQVNEEKEEPVLKEQIEKQDQMNPIHIQKEQATESLPPLHLSPPMTAYPTDIDTLTELSTVADRLASTAQPSTLASTVQSPQAPTTSLMAPHITSRMVLSRASRKSIHYPSDIDFLTGDSSPSPSHKTTNSLFSPHFYQEEMKCQERIDAYYQQLLVSAPQRFNQEQGLHKARLSIDLAGIGRGLCEASETKQSAFDGAMAMLTEAEQESVKQSNENENLIQSKTNHSTSPLLPPLSAITRMDLSHQKLRHLDASLFSLPHLTELIMNHNEIEHLKELPSGLELFSATHNRLVHFQLPLTLKHLNLSFNPLKRLGFTVQGMLLLETAQFSHCQFEQLNDFLSMTCLTELNLEQNPIDSFSDLFKIKKLSQLQKLTFHWTSKTETGSSDEMQVKQTCYRWTLILSLPRLKELDGEKVSDWERSLAKRRLKRLKRFSRESSLARLPSLYNEKMENENEKIKSETKTETEIFQSNEIISASSFWIALDQPLDKPERERHHSISSSAAPPLDRLAVKRALCYQDRLRIIQQRSLSQLSSLKQFDLTTHTRQGFFVDA